MKKTLRKMITTTDNNCGDCTVEAQYLDDLEKIANVNICDQVEHNQNLLVFPQMLNEYGDNIGENPIFSLNGNKLETGNIMGFVGVNSTQVTIKSRFANTDNNDYFLHYMLQKVFAINLFNLQHNSADEEIFDFRLYLFPYFLKKAMQQGLFKEYQRHDYNDANLRGVIDVSRHIRQNIPFGGKVAYSTREHTYDNRVTQLIRHTIEFIRTHPFGANILNNDEDTKDCVSKIIFATQTYSRNDRQNVINQNLRPLRHPFFANYAILQRICMQILRHKQIKYGEKENQIYGVLFDGAWLWEEYLNTILNKCGFTHAENKTSRNRIYLFMNYRGYPRYPDFYKTDFVLDAKYKKLEDKIDRDDMHQVITYMHVLKCNNGGFVFPCEREIDNKIGVLRGYGGTVYKYGMKIPQNAGDFNDFCKKIKDSENKLSDKISEIKYAVVEE